MLQEGQEDYSVAEETGKENKTMFLLIIIIVVACILIISNIAFIIIKANQISNQVNNSSSKMLKENKTTNPGKPPPIEPAPESITKGNVTNETSPETNQTKENVSIEYYDCGTSHECFLEKIKTCTPAKATLNTTQEIEYGETIFGINFEFVETIEGIENETCIVMLTCTKSSLFKSLEGKEMLCAIPLGELENFEQYIKEHINESCSGPLYDEIGPTIEWKS